MKSPKTKKQIRDEQKLKKFLRLNEQPKQINTFAKNSGGKS